MTITALDLKLFASAYPLDEPYGGGPMIAYVVQDGVENNIFPDVDAGARAAGRVQLRKVYLAVTSPDADTLSAAQISLLARPSDSAVGVVAFVAGGETSTRSEAAARLIAQPYRLGPFLGTVPTPSTTFVLSLAFPIPLGTLVAFASPAAGTNGLPPFGAVGHVTALSGSGPYNVTFSMRRGAVPAAPDYTAYILAPADAAARCVGLTTLTASVLAGATTISVAAVEQKVLPVTDSWPVVANGLGTFYGPNGTLAEDVSNNAGLVPIFRNGDTVVLRNGGTTETAVVAFVDYRGGLTFTTSLANPYPSGATVSSLLSLGDQPVIVGASFSQQTWTRVFSDALIGNSIGVNYNRTAGVITSSNLGSATERWAIVFTSATAFKLIGETFGQIAEGETSAAFSPLNPLTNTPYFTIPAEGWGAGWATGNVLRFNTLGSRAPFWVARTVAPSVPASSDGLTFELRGTVGA